MSAAILEAVLGNLVVATALVAAAFAVGRWTNRPAIGHVLWLLVLVKLLTPPVFTVPVKCLPARPESPAPVVPSAPVDALEPAPVVIAEPDPRPALVPSAPAPHAPVATQVARPNAHPTPDRPAPLTIPLPSWESVLLGVWALGTSASLVLAVRRVWRFSRLLGEFATPASPEFVAEVAAAAERMGLRCLPRIRILPGGVAPLLWAVGRPTLYFPAGLLTRLTAEQRFTLIAHELAHLRRWDHIVRLIEFTALAVYWWCPLAWLARREMRRLEEEACDAEVVAAAPASGYAYASAILETIDYLAGVPASPSFASGIGDAESLRRRLVLILSVTNSARASRHLRRLLLVAGLAALAVVPRFDRLTAAATEVVFGTAGPPARHTPDAPAADEPFVESVQFLPTPARLVAPEALGSAPSNASAVSPDGSRLAVAVGANVVVWDLRANRLLFTLTGHTEVVNAVCFAPDGKTIATAGSDNRGIVWSAVDGKQLHVLDGHWKWVMAVCFSPDGKTIATGGYDKTVRLWDAANGAPKGTWVGYSGGVRAICYSPDGKTIAIGGAECEIQLLDVARNVVVHTLQGHRAAVRVVCFSPDGSRLASGSEDRTVRLWDTEGKAVGGPVTLPDYATALAFSRRGLALFAGTFGGHLLGVNPATGQLRGYIGVELGRPAGTPAHADAITSISVPPEGAALFTVSQDRVALAWPAAGPLHAPRQVFRGARPMTAVALSPDGKTLATAGQDGVIRLWDASAARELMTLPGHPGGVSVLMFGAGGFLVSAGGDEQVRIWDVASGRAVYAVLQPAADLRLALSPDGKTLAIGGRKVPGFRLLNLASPGKMRRIGDWAGGVTALSFTPSGAHIATGDTDGIVRVWDTVTGMELVRGSVGAGTVDAISFSSTGPFAAVVLNAEPRTDGEAESGPAHEVVFLDTRDGSVPESRPRLAHPSRVTAAAFTADGLLTAADDGNLYLWNPGTGRIVRTVRGHVDAVRGIALTADGRAVFSAGDKSAKKWPMATK
jgi:WD40 repeat protein/beta-lactamase regulating signal transducer with metallopeptidase domain